MATNIKNINSEKYNRVLSLEDRVSLEKIITTNREKDGSLTLSLNDIGAMLEKDITTLSKEVKKCRTSIQMNTPNFAYTGLYCKSCTKSKDCKEKEYMKGKQGICSNYDRIICKYLTFFKLSMIILYF
ncbi:MAG: hypothetical protein NC310_08320 [Roseburia sp.]|nr:hypothetical protein [Anaeroplasma bactoclasticum]MCM1197054.1 hypothetical protein [Roseburia sp.]MCM1557702.1 hypothetical protein [Anaeroplasma bactoclasticum]